MKNKLIVTAACLLSATLSACATSPEQVSRVLAGVSSGIIGCQSDMIKITDKPITIGGLHEWTAECNGMKYACSYIHGGVTNCTESKAQTQTQAQAISATDDCINRSRYNSTLICPPK